MPELETEFAITVKIVDPPDIGIRISIVDPMGISVRIDPLR